MDSRTHQPSRREALGLLGAAVFAGGRRSFADVTCVAPAASQTEGPYWVDEMLKRSDIRSDPSDSAVEPGVPLNLGINLHEIRGNSCSPLANAQVDIWQCDASGLYSDEDRNRTRGQKFLRGYQTSSDKGAVEFVTIYPGWYMGRTIHIHVRVRRRLESGKTDQFTAQFYFPDDLSDEIMKREPYNRRGRRATFNKNDMVLRESESDEGVILYPAMKALDSGYQGAIEMGVDFSKERQRGPGPGRGFGPPPRRPRP